MKTLLALIWLRWRLIINEIRTAIFPRSRSLHLIFVVLYFLLFFFIGVSGSFLINLSVKFQGSKHWLQLGNSFVSILFLPIFIGKIFSSGEIFKRVYSKSLRHYPIKAIALYMFDLAFRLIDRWYLMLACFLFGFIIGFGFPTNPIFALLSLSFIIFMIILGLHIIIEIFEETLQLFLSFLKIVRYLSSVMAVILLCLFVDVPSIFNNPLELIQTYTPIGFLNSALYGLYVEHNMGMLSEAIWNSFLFISASFVILIFVYEFRKIFVFEPLSNNIIRKTRPQFTFDRIIFIFPQSLTPYIIKDLRYFVRSRMKIFMLLELALLLYFFYNIGESSQISITFSLLLFPCIFWGDIVSNLFGMEKKCFWFLSF